MKIKMSSWAILNPLIVSLAMIALVIGGIYSFHLLPVNGMPTVRIPVISVSISLPGASSSDIENQVTIPVENVVANISNIKHVTSYVENGLSVTQIEFRYGTGIKNALNTVRDKVSSIRSQLPKGVSEPLIQQSEDDNTPLMTYVFQSFSTPLPLLTQEIDKELISDLMAIDGVEKVERQGGYDREIHIELIPEKLFAAGISAFTVNSQLQSFISQMPAGKVNLGQQETYLRIQGSPSSADALAKMQIFVGNGHYVQLSSIGLVRDTFKEAQQLTRLDRQPAIGVAIYRNARGNELKIATAIGKIIKHWQAKHQSVIGECIQSQIDFTKKTYTSAAMSFLEGILLAGLVVFIFLKSFRATIIAAIAIPLSVVPTFIVMHWLGFSLNLVSMLALSLVSGILVDDAIVEIENILRHTNAGKTPYQASMFAADEIGLAVIATSLVIIAVFAPVSFMGGVVGQYFIQFGITVATATFFSLLVARLITPVMAAYFLKPININEHKFSWDPVYTDLLKKSLAHRPLSLVLIGLVLLLSIGLLFWLPADFIPQEDKSYFMLQVDLPSDARLKDTDHSVQNVSNWIMQQPEVSHVYSWIGGRDNETTVSGQVNHATLIVKLIPRDERTLSVEQFKVKALYHLQSIPNIRVSTLNENGTKAFGLVLRSNDPTLLYKTSLALENEMRSLPMLSDVLSTVPSIKNNLIVTPKIHDAAKLGLSASSLGDELRTALNDAHDEQVAHVYLANQFVPVKSFIRIPEQSTIAFLKQLPITTSDQHIIPLSSVANLELKPDYSNFTRYDRMRQVMVSADINGVSLGDAMKQVTALHSLKNLPTGISIGETGDSEMLSEMLSAFSVAIISGLLVVLIVLILLFRTLLQPLTIMTALPLSISGALIALIMTNQAISLPSVIGILMLMGIVGKNGILIVDFIIEKRKEGMSREEAIIVACQQRSRPIIMTSIAMIAGMIPVIFGAGAGTGFRTPMAYAVIGGLITSTLLSLIVVPLIYTVIDDLERSIKKRFSSLANSY